MLGGGALPLASLNHISLVCRSLERSLDFYHSVLGFSPVRRPGSFDFDGAWLFNYGIGIHLLQSEYPEDMPEKSEINPKDNHISFQVKKNPQMETTYYLRIECESMASVEKKLKEMGINYIKRRVEEGGIFVDQLFFHDPDGFMIEICNCDNLPVIPLAGEQMSVCKTLNFMKQQQQQQQQQVKVQCHAASIHATEEPHISCA